MIDTMAIPMTAIITKALKDIQMGFLILHHCSDTTSHLAFVITTTGFVLSGYSKI
jgi:hypothetical protein